MWLNEACSIPKRWNPQTQCPGATVLNRVHIWFASD
jgi:hypothetical protein